MVQELRRWCDVLYMSVRMFKPKTLAEAYSLVKLQEITVVVTRDQPKPLTKTPCLGAPYRALSTFHDTNAPPPPANQNPRAELLLTKCA